jgi:tetratricopeptide (TPR) repeat protein
MSFILKNRKAIIFSITMILMLTLLFAVLVQAQESQQLFHQGNSLYQDGLFLEALETYHQITDGGYENGPLYFNMGNCYYKLNDIGHAILYYEKARKFFPGDEDLKANLVLANLAVMDKIEPLPQFILIRAARGIIYLLPLNVLLWVAAGLYLFFMGFFILRNVVRSTSLRKFFMQTGIVVAILCIVSGLLLIGQIADAKNRIEAVIMENKVDVKGSPSDEGVEVFTIHQGTKVRIDQESGDWVEIVLADGKVGWVKRDVFEII